MIEIDDLRYALNTGDLTAEETIFLTDLEKRAVAFVERTTGRHFGATQTFTEILDGKGNDTLWLNEAPGSITTVEERARAGDAWSVITDFELRGARVIRTDGKVWTSSYEYRVTYDFGYAAGSEPGEIRQLVIDLVKLKYDERCTNIALSSEALADERYTRDAFTSKLESIPWVRETLDAWRWPRVA